MSAILERKDFPFKRGVDFDVALGQAKRFAANKPASRVVIEDEIVAVKWPANPEDRNACQREAFGWLMALTNEERVEVFRMFCISCGRDNPCCQCWNDE